MGFAGAFTVLKTAYGLYSTYKGYQEQNAMLEYQSDVQEYGAQIEEFKAVDAEERGKIQARLEMMKAANAAGVHKTTEVGGGEGGAAVGVGSRYDTVEDIMVNGAMMAKLAKRNGDMEAWGHRRQKDIMLSNADMLDSQKTSGFDMIAGTVFGNAAGLGKSWDSVKPGTGLDTIAVPQNSSLPLAEQGPVRSSVVQSETLNSLSFY